MPSIKRKKIRKKLVSITFWDHALASSDEAKLIKCEATGWLYKTTNLAYYLVYWICDSNLNDNNSESIVILKSTVIKKRVYK